MGGDIKGMPLALFLKVKVKSTGPMGNILLAIFQKVKNKVMAHTTSLMDQFTKANSKII